MVRAGLWITCGLLTGGAFLYLGIAVVRFMETGRIRRRRRPRR
jgi:hypothetical protein